jgi:hypothetical protein
MSAWATTWFGVIRTPNRSDVGATVGAGGGQLPGSRAFGEEPVVFGFVHDMHGRTPSHLKTVVIAPR